MMIKCARCRISYSHARSTSALALTYCCLMCEVADLGYSLAAFEKAPLAELRLAAHPVSMGYGDSAIRTRMAA